MKRRLASLGAARKMGERCVCGENTVEERSDAGSVAHNFGCKK